MNWNFQKEGKMLADECAVEKYQKAVRFDPDFVDAWCGRSFAWMVLVSRAKAVEEFKSCVIVMKYLSKELQILLSKQMRDAPTLEDCIQCKPSGGISHHCCKTPGFAVYENIQLIYSEYVSHLWEAVPFGNKNLSIDQFVQFYFTQVIFTSIIAGDRVLLKLYFPKIIDHTTITDHTTGKMHRFGPRIMPDANLDLFVSFPDDFYDFYAKRNVERPANQGCVFLQRGEDFHIKHSKGCLLHANDSAKQITTKPIDCVSFNCKLKDSEKDNQQRTITYFGELLMQFGAIL